MIQNDRSCHSVSFNDLNYADYCKFSHKKVALIMITWADLINLMRMTQIVTFLLEILGNPTAKTRTTRSYFYEKGSIPILRFQSVGA